MTNFTIINDVETQTFNHPVFDAIRNSCGLEFSDLHDLTNGLSLSEDNLADINNYMFRNLFKKVEDDLGFDPMGTLKQATIEHLAQTHVSALKFRAILEVNPVNLMKVLNKARDILHEMFRDWDPYAIVPRYTSGATPGLKRGENLLTRVKTGSGWSSLEARLPRILFHTLMSKIPSVPDSVSSHFTVWDMVSKNAKIGRPIGYHEPYTLAFQSGVGDYIVSRFKNYSGIDFATAQSVHREYALICSLVGEYSTMDQSNASQNILRPHCNFLLPEEMFTFVDAICPDVIDIDGTKYVHSMMAAQGNGLNSPLQTVIFYALIKACAYVKGIKGDILVYGDDTMFKEELFDTVSSVFTSIGFEVNQSKSFKTGPIRESCGMDAYLGQNVRAYYAKTFPKTTVEWYRFCNGIIRMGYYHNDNIWRTNALRDFWLRCVSNIPTSVRYYGPPIYGDAVLHHWDERKYTIKERSNGQAIRAYSTVNTSQGRSFGQLIQGLPAQEVFKAVAFPDLKGSGSVRYSEQQLKNLEDKHGDSYKEKLCYYPKTLGIRLTEDKPVWLDYPPARFDADNLDEMFEVLNFDVSDRLKRYDGKMDFYRRVLIKTLKEVRIKNSKLLKTVIDIDL